MHKAEREYINNTKTQGLQTNNSKPFRKYIKSRKQDNIGVAPLKKADILLDKLQSVIPRYGGSAPPRLDPPQHPIICYHFIAWNVGNTRRCHTIINISHFMFKSIDLSLYEPVYALKLF